jgi:hypothetical protein
MLQDLAAFLILPGLIKLKYLKQLSQGKNLRVIDFLRDVDNAFDAGAKIIEVARGYAAGQRLRRETPSPDTVIPGLARRAKQLVKEQRYSAACELVDRIQSRLDDPAANLNPMPLAEARGHVSRLHPPANDRDALPLWGPNEIANCLQVSRAEVEFAVKDLCLASAPGASGWTYRAISSVLLFHSGAEVDPEYDACINAFTSWTNVCLRRAWDSRLCALLVVGRSVLIPKDDNGWRPLGIGECWYRVMARMLSTKVSSSVGEKLQPLQFGISIKGGVEICARLCQLTCLSRQDHSLLSTDVKNAFNTLRRSEIYAGVQQHAPGLLGFFHSFYSVEAELRNSRGELVGASATGVRQGDPLGGLFYCCGAHRTWTELQHKFMSLRQNNDVALVWGFHDDFHFYGSNTAIEEFIETLDAEELKERGFCFVREKTIAVGPFASTLAGIRTSEDGHKFVGVHCGTNDYVGASNAALLRHYARSLPALLHLDAQTALILIAQCINKRPGYLSRVWENGADFLSYDFDISHCILTIACGGNYQYSNDNVNLITMVRALPELQGGLNIESYHFGIRRAQGVMASRAFVSDFLEEHVPWLVSLQRELEEQPSVVSWLESSFTSHPTHKERFADKSKPHEIRAEAFAIVAESGQATLINSNRTAEARRMASSAFAGSARWVYWLGGIRHQSLWRDQDFRMALRSRLLLPLCSNAASMTNSLPCSCGQFNNILEQNQDHLLLCQHNRALATHRHTLMRNALAAYCGGYCKGGGTVTTEPLLGNLHRADVLMRQANGITRILEVGITSCFATNLNVQNWEPGFAAGMMEIEKRTDFARKLLAEGANVTDIARNAADNNEFVPFVLESTGRLGVEARRFLDSLTKIRGSQFTKKDFLNEISALMAQASARMRLNGLLRAERLIGSVV